MYNKQSPSVHAPAFKVEGCFVPSENEGFVFVALDQPPASLLSLWHEREMEKRRSAARQLSKEQGIEVAPDESTPTGFESCRLLSIETADGAHDFEGVLYRPTIGINGHALASVEANRLKQVSRDRAIRIFKFDHQGDLVGWSYAPVTKAVA